MNIRSEIVRGEEAQERIIKSAEGAFTLLSFQLRHSFLSDEQLVQVVDFMLKQFKVLSEAQYDFLLTTVKGSENQSELEQKIIAHRDLYR